MAKKRRPNWRKIKRHYNYTVDEAARALGCHKGTVRRWLGKGLPALTDKKPTLILGDDLIAFLKARATRKHKCALDECYCLKCRAPRKAADGMADLTDPTPTGGNLQALCEECGTFMYKRVSHRQLTVLKGILDVRQPLGGTRAGAARRTDVGGLADGATTPAVTSPTETIEPEAANSSPPCKCPATERQTHLMDCPEPRPNDHLPEAPEDHA